MKQTVTLTNMEIVEAVKALQNPNSILNSTDQKYPISFLWKLRTNSKKLIDLHSQIAEAERKIEESYSNEEKSTQNKDKGWQVKREFLNDFYKEKTDLFNLTNDVELDVVNINEIADFSFSASDFNSIAFMLTDDAVM